MFTVHDVAQRSSEWHQLRLGLLTGSCAETVIAERKRGAGELKERVTLRRRLICERLTGLSAENGFQSDDMRRGSDLEPLAFAAYEARTGRIVQRVGFLKHNEHAAGCSPDGYVGEWTGVIELKCPKSTTHLEYIQAGILPPDYRGQCLHALWLTGAPWVDLCSFDPRFPAALELFIVRLERSELEMVAYENTVLKFLAEVAEEERALRERLTGPVALGAA